MRLNKSTDYAIRILMEIAKSARLMNCTELSKQVGVSEGYTSRLLQELRQKGFLFSEHGAFGGYKLIKDSEKITLYDVIQVMEGISMLEKLEGTAQTGGTVDVLYRELEKMQKAMEEQMKSITIGAMVADESVSQNTKK